MFGMDSLPLAIHCRFASDLVGRAILVSLLAVPAVTSAVWLPRAADIMWCSVAFVGMGAAWRFADSRTTPFLLVHGCLLLAVLSSVGQPLRRAQRVPLAPVAASAAVLTGWSLMGALVLAPMTPLGAMFGIECRGAIPALGASVGFGAIALVHQRRYDAALRSRVSAARTLWPSVRSGALRLLCVATVALLIATPRACVRAMGEGDGSQYSHNRRPPPTCSDR